MSGLCLSLLGTPCLELDGLPLRFDTRKNLALVAYLAVTGLGPRGELSGQGRQTREALITLLWPELDPGRARAGLRRNLSMLKRALGGEWLVAERERIGFDPAADFWLDVAQFRLLLLAWQEHGHPEGDVCPECLAVLAQAAELYRGDFMEGFTLRDSANFDEWQFFQTEGLRQEFASGLERLVRGHSAQGAYERAITYARRWLALDSLQEPVHRHLMQLYAWSGQRAAALRQAFALATDQEALAHVALRGYAFPASGGLVPPGMPGHSPEIGLPYDPEAACRLLAKAGYPGGRGFPPLGCLARDDPGHDLLCEYLQAQWLETLGVEIRWDEIEWQRFLDRLSEGRPNLWMVGWYADYPDPDNFLRIQWWVAPDWQNRAYDQLVEEARCLVDQEERMRMYSQAERTLVDEAPVLPLCYARFHMLMKPWVRKYTTSPLRWWSWKDVILEPH